MLKQVPSTSRLFVSFFGEVSNFPGGRRKSAVLCSAFNPVDDKTESEVKPIMLFKHEPCPIGVYELGYAPSSRMTFLVTPEGWFTAMVGPSLRSHIMARVPSCICQV